MKAPTTEMLAANGSTAWHTCLGTLVQFQLSATFGGGAVALEIKDAAGNAIPLTDDSGTAISITVATARNLEVPSGSEVRATLSGATAPSLLVSIKEISDGRSQY